jgi:putative ABC transport system permease protein
VIQSNRDLRRSALEVFDRTFAITMALRLLATIVAFIGVLSALMALQLERSRELGLLRATGITPRELWRLTLFETGLMGAMAGLLAVPLGLILAIILIYVINLRSFGWTIQMVLDPGYFVQALLVAIVAALAAGVYPALRVSRMAPARALREE